MKTQNQNPVGQERHMFLTVKSIDQANPNLVHVTVSTDEIDRYDEIVLPESFRESLPSFKQNPVVLPAHQHRLENGEPPVIGNVLPDTILISGRTVDMDILFDDDELGQKYARKYQKKVMRAFSIGFRGLEGKYEERESKKVWTWTKIELLEVSPVAVPANRGALARANGYFDSDKDAIAEAVAEQFTKLQSFIEQKFDDLNSVIIANSGGLADSLLGENSELSEPGGAEQKLSEHLTRIETACRKVG
jgi:HK97 family phage prohead protease